MSKAGKQASTCKPMCKPSRLSIAEGGSHMADMSTQPVFSHSSDVWQVQHLNMHQEEQQDTHADADLMPQRCTSPVPQTPIPLHLPTHISDRLGTPFKDQRRLHHLPNHPTMGSNSSRASTTTSQQQQIIDEALSMIPGMQSMQHQQLYQNIPASAMCSSPGGSSCLQDDDALMDFWVLLQQTQHNLQDMLVDLETAKIELELAKGRADEAEHAAKALRVHLAASQQCNTALETQLQNAQAKESAAAAKVAILTQRNTELATQVHQAQQAAASMELKFERLQGQLATMQRNNAAAAAVDAACASAAHESAVAAAVAAIATQLKSELSQAKSELAGTQSRAARAELELAVARTKVLVSQQEAAAAADRCTKLERQVTSLSTQLGAATASAAVAAEEKQRLQVELEAVQLKLEAKEARLRGSMNALARASSSLRASYSAQGGALEPALQTSRGSVSQLAAELRISAQMTAGLLQRAQDMRASQHMQQQQSPRQQAAHACLDTVAAEHPNSNNGESMKHSSTPQQQGSEQQQQSQQHLQPSQGQAARQHRHETGLKRVEGYTGFNQRPGCPFAAASTQPEQQEQQNVPHSEHAHEPHQEDLSQHQDSCDSSRTLIAPATSCHSMLQGTTAVEKQSPIFKQHRSTAGGASRSNRSSGGASSSRAAASQQRRISRSSSGGGSSTASIDSLSPRVDLVTAGPATSAIFKACALPPRPPRSSSTSSSTTPRSARGSNPGLSPRFSSGSGCTTGYGCVSELLSSASSSTPLFGSPCPSRRTSSCSAGGAECSGSRLEAASSSEVCLQGEGDYLCECVAGVKGAGSGDQVEAAGGEAAPDLCHMAVADKPAAVVLSKCAKSEVQASTEAAWAPDTGVTVCSGSQQDTRIGDEMAAAEGSAVVMISLKHVLRGVSDCSTAEGSTPRQLSTAGISSLVASTRMGLEATGGLAGGAAEPMADHEAGNCSIHNSGSSSSPSLVWGNGVERNRTKLRGVLAVLLPLGVSAAGAVLGGMGLLQHHRARKQPAATMQLLDPMPILTANA